MRSALLASAAFFMTAGVAMAQTSMTSPAPTGAPNAAMSTPAPQASSGNMAPSSNAAASAASEGVNPAQSGGLTTSSKAAQTSPHYNGEDSVSPPASSASAGGMGNAAMASSQSGMGMKHMAYGSGTSAAIPADADATQYLKIASKAIKQHNKMMADDALSHAETRMLDRAVPASSGAQADESPAVTAIERARAALSSGDYQTAAQDTRMAMHARHGMMGGSAMSPMGDAGAMSGPAQ